MRKLPFLTPDGYDNHDDHDDRDGHHYNDDHDHDDPDDYDDHLDQGGRTWQPFVGGKNGNESFRQARIYNFRDKCIVFAHNRKFAKLTQ